MVAHSETELRSKIVAGGGVVLGTLLQSLPAQAHEHCGFLITDPFNSRDRDFRFLAGKPAAGFNDQLPNGPIPMIHEKVAKVAFDTIACSESVGLEDLCAPQLPSSLILGSIGCGG